MFEIPVLGLHSAHYGILSMRLCYLDPKNKLAPAAANPVMFAFDFKSTWFKTGEIRL
jgi:hypothetical protein